MIFFSPPAIWLIVLIVGLPQLSETVYTPSLPDIARALSTSESMTEYTLTIYLLGFATGTLFWGKISDKFGRKPCVLSGLLTFFIGCAGCYVSNSIEGLMISRFVQAFGGSIGSVLGQAICRDAFHGPTLGKVYSATGSALALFPALGPLCGGFVAEMFGWKTIFIFLGFFSFILILFVWFLLPETHPRASRKQISLWTILVALVKDRRVIGFGFIVGGCNGLLFSYFAEGSFYLINGLNLSPSKYGLTFMAMAAATMSGGIFSKKLQNTYSSKEIMNYGLLIITFSTAIFSSFALVHHTLHPFDSQGMILVTIISQMGCSFGICMTTSHALALALVDYKQAIGTASSLFGFFYYGVVSVCTYFMGLLHDGTLLPMPLYFLALGCFMIFINRVFLRKETSMV